MTSQTPIPPDRKASASSEPPATSKPLSPGEQKDIALRWAQMEESLTQAQIRAIEEGGRRARERGELPPLPEQALEASSGANVTAAGQAAPEPAPRDRTRAMMRFGVALAEAEARWKCGARALQRAAERPVKKRNASEGDPAALVIAEFDALRNQRRRATEQIEPLLQQLVREAELCAALPPPPATSKRHWFDELEERLDRKLIEGMEEGLCRVWARGALPPLSAEDEGRALPCDEMLTPAEIAALREDKRRAVAEALALLRAEQQERWNLPKVE